MYGRNAWRSTIEERPLAYLEAHFPHHMLVMALQKDRAGFPAATRKALRVKNIQVIHAEVLIHDRWLYVSAVGVEAPTHLAPG